MKGLTLRSVVLGIQFILQVHARPQATPLPPDASSCAYWLESIPHRGVAAFNTVSNYTVFRNVRDYGATGNGVTDDTAAINNAISSGARHGPATGTASTNTPAVVYFPAGTYLISSSIIDYYFTQLIGNPNCMPVIKAASDFSASSLGLIDGDQYGANGLGFGATNVFWRQIRNFIIDTTAVPPATTFYGIHWPTAQATSLQNIIFRLPQAKNTQHTGVLVEGGSGGFMTDLIFIGGKSGLDLANQQFTMRNLSFSNCQTAINQLFDWGWTYKGITVNNCSYAINMTTGGSNGQSVAAVVLIDSLISNTPVGVLTVESASSLPPSSGNLVLENVIFQNVPVAVQAVGGVTKLAGSTSSVTIAGWSQGHRYTPKGPHNSTGTNLVPNSRPSTLVSGSIFYQRSKPQYANLPVSAFLSVRASGAAGNGVTDDTRAVQAALNQAAASNLICFFDAGTYLVTSTIIIPAGSKVVGESFSVIMSSGSFFNSMSSPQPVVAVGSSNGQPGQVEWSDMIVSTQGPQAGAILIQWNILSSTALPSGMWDVHTRIGGFIGSQLQGNVCPVTNTTKITSSNLPSACIAAYLSMHINTGAGSLYMENNWLWTADHDVDANFGGNQISIYTGRGLLCESSPGTIWLYGTAVEHHTKYQYQFLNTKNIFAGQIQTETPYFQPNPNATIPFPAVSAISDPVFPSTPYLAKPYDNSTVVPVPNANAWGLRVLSSTDVLLYGVGLYSFFNNQVTKCSDEGNGSICQSRIFQAQNSSVFTYDLHTVGTQIMAAGLGGGNVDWEINQAGFTDNVAVLRS